MKITSTTNKLIKEICLLKKASSRKERKEFLVQGNDFILPSKNSKSAKMIFAMEEKEYGIPLTIVSKDVMKKISIYENSEEPVILCSYLDRDKAIGNRLVYLDGVQDPGNVGTIIRTALALNYDGVILSSKCASLYSPKVISASKGAIFDLPIYEDISLDELKAKGYEIIASALQNAIDYKDTKIKQKAVIVFGSEGQGVSEHTLSIADKIVKIEINSIDSLNVAVAAGIILERYRL